MNDLIEKAKKLGVNVVEFTNEDGKKIYQLEKNGAYRYIVGTLLPLNTSASARISKSKDLTKKVLSAAGLRTPRGFLVKEGENVEALMTQNNISFPIVIKPNDAALGKDVFVDIKNITDAKEKVSIVLKDTEYALVEELVPYTDHRVLVIDGIVEGVIKREQPFLVGDGVHTISELVDLYNVDRYEGRPATLDDESLRYIGTQGFTAESVLNDKEKVILRGNANFRTGGSATNVTESLSSFFESVAVKAATVLGMRIAGVDILSADIAGDEKTPYVITEVNSLPGFDIHQAPTSGVAIDPTEAAITAMFRSYDKN